MKIYIAAPFESKPRVYRLYRKLRAGGHRVTHDWTKHKYIVPFENNIGLAAQYAKNDITGVRRADVFIMFADKRKSVGMATELGAAILSNILFKRPIIYVITGKTSRSMFYYHKSVSRVKNETELLEKMRISPPYAF